MPLLKKPHGKRERHQVWAELTFPPQMYKARQGIFPLRAELMEKDPLFRRDVVRIRQNMNSYNVSMQDANNQYFAALDAAIRRRQKKVA